MEQPMNPQGTRFEYGTIEWMWDQGKIRINLSGNREFKQQGTYNEVVALLNQLGAEGWGVASCVAAGNWLFWTLHRPYA